jgi:hypothetical protein
MKHLALEPEQKALEINLDDRVYGTFAEIGAGQEVARHFFQAGAAAGTIAKTMSAYDKVYSDEIYGSEPTGRYVCEARLYKMLNHEYELLEERLTDERPDTTFFAFADTVAAINYHKTIKGDGWLGIRFQVEPNGDSNDVVLHVKLLDNSNGLQQQAIGVLGVNLVYAVFRYYNDPETFCKSLVDSLKGRVQVDMVRMTGPAFEQLDNRLLPLYLVKHGLCDVSMFDKKGQPVHASEFLYRKNVLVLRGSFRPATLVNEDMLKVSTKQFKAESDVEPRKTKVLTEITLSNLKNDGELDEKDFLDRADILCAMGQTVVISNCDAYTKLIDYLADFKVNKTGLVVGARVLLDLINEKYYSHSDGSLLAAFGELFRKNVKVYVYPIMQEGTAELMTAKNLPIPDAITFLYRHLIDSQQITDLEGYDRKILHIFSKTVLEMITNDEEGWERYVSLKVSRLIKDECLFNYPKKYFESIN